MVSTFIGSGFFAGFGCCLGLLVLDFEGMPPKAIQPYPPQGYFSHFNRWYNDLDFVELLRGGFQSEQITFWDLFARMPHGFYIEKLFPHVGPTFYTQLEIALLAAVQFMVFTIPDGVPRPELYANFMVYMTLPEKLFIRIFAPVVSGPVEGRGTRNYAPITLRIQDAPWFGDFLNLCFSPRSAFLMFTFSLSFMQRNGHTFPQVAEDRPITFGFRPCFEFMQDFGRSADIAMWNRWHFDYFLRAKAFTFGTLELWTLFTVLYPQSCYFAVDKLNELFEGSGNFVRWMHMPIRQDFVPLIDSQAESTYVAPALLRALATPLRARL